MAKLRIRYTKSAIGYSSRQKDTIRSLGLRKLQSVVIHNDTPAIRGMAFHVRHLVTLEEIDESQIEAPKKRPVTTIVLKSSEQSELQSASSHTTPATSPMLASAEQVQAPALDATIVLDEPVMPETPVVQATVALADTVNTEATPLEEPITNQEDLELIEGIGPKIADTLHGAGIHTFAQLAETSQESLEELLRGAKLYGGLASMSTWAEQAALAAAGKWDDLKQLQERLNAGRDAEGDTQ